VLLILGKNFRLSAAWGNSGHGAVSYVTKAFFTDTTNLAKEIDLWMKPNAQ
jgi:hypothetical protein